VGGRGVPRRLVLVVEPWVDLEPAVIHAFLALRIDGETLQWWLFGLYSEGVWVELGAVALGLAWFALYLHWEFSSWRASRAR
jgi:hypothetical protein